MQIRAKLTLQFLLLGGIIMIATSVVIYYFSARYFRNDFYDILKSRARTITLLALDSYDYNANHALRTGSDLSGRLVDEKILILGEKGDTLYIYDKNWIFRDLYSLTGRIVKGGDIHSRQDQYEVLGTLYESGSFRFHVIAAAIDTAGPQRLRNLAVILIAACLFSLLMFSVAGWFFSGRALKPLSDMVRRVEAISITSLNLRVPEGNGSDELGRLAITFNKMLERLETSFSMQKDFIAHASHELRTPLTSINGQIEVLLMKDRSAVEYKSALNSVIEDIRSLISLSNKLLLLAGTSAESPVKARKKIRVDEVLWQAGEEIRKFNPGFRINILIDDSLTDSGQMLIGGDENLIRVAVSNIIENACKYSADHTVNIKILHHEQEIIINFEDRGIGIPGEDLPKIFDPFYRGFNTVAVRGSGIGLPLARRIIRNYNGNITVSSSEGKGTTVKVVFPSLP